MPFKAGNRPSSLLNTAFDEGNRQKFKISFDALKLRALSWRWVFHRLANEVQPVRIVLCALRPGRLMVGPTTVKLRDVKI